jgi:hypothetical protein
MDYKKFVQASGWLMETLLTMTLVFVVFAATDTNRAKISTHLPVGACVESRDLAIRGPNRQTSRLTAVSPTSHHCQLTWDDVMCRYLRLWLSAWQCSSVTW